MSSITVGGEDLGSDPYEAILRLRRERDDARAEAAQLRQEAENLRHREGAMTVRREELEDIRERAEFYEQERDRWRATAEAQRSDVPQELAEAMAETRAYRDKLTAARDRLDQLAAYFEESARASSPGKKSEIERHAAKAVREAAAGIADQP